MALSFEDIIEDLSKILKPKRFTHTLNVNKTALKINKMHKLGLNEDQIQYAALLHDCAKGVEEKYFEEYKEKYSLDYEKIFEIPPIAHAILGGIVAKERYGVKDPIVLDAIRWHTTGKENMTLLNKVLCAADFIEPGRDFEHAKIARKKVEKDFYDGLFYLFDVQIKHLEECGQDIDINTLKARDYLLKESYE